MSDINKFGKKYYEAYPNAFYGKNPTNLIQKNDIEELIRIMDQRKKTVRYCLHEKTTDLVHISVIATSKNFSNAIHKHPNKIETIHALHGNANLCFYSNDKKIMDIQNVNSIDKSIAQIPKNMNHNLELISENFVFIEISQGPFDSESTIYI
jgi:cupin fold WbuC family metalloprotein